MISVNGTNNVTTNVTILPDASSAVVQRWFVDRGQILLYKAPEETLRLAIRPVKRVYNPGEQAQFDVIVTSSTGRAIPATEQFYLSVDVTESSRAPRGVSQIARNLLGGEVTSQELANSNDYVNAIIGNGDARPLDLVLGTQGWRYGAFDLANIERIARSINTLSPADREAFQQLYGFSFNAALPTPVVNARQTPSSFAFPQVETPSADFIGNVTSPRAFSKVRDAGFRPTETRDRTNTLFFASNLLVRGGTNRLSFFLSDLITTFTIQAELISANGRVAVSASETISTINSYSVQISNAPSFLTVGDSVTLSVEIRSTGPAVALPSRVFVSSDPSILTVSAPVVPTTVAVNGIGRVNIQVVALAAASSVSINIVANATAANLPYEARTSATLQVRSIPALSAGPSEVSQAFPGTFATVRRLTGGSSFTLTLPQNYQNGSSSFSLDVLNNRNDFITRARRSFERAQPTIDNQIVNAQFALQDHNTLISVPVATLNQPGTQLLVQESLNNLNNWLFNFLATFRNSVDGGFRLRAGEETSVVATALALNFLTEFNRVVRVDANVTASARAYVLRFRTGFGGFNNTRSEMSENATNAFILLNLVRSGAFVNTEFNSEITALRAVADAEIRNGTVRVYFLSLLGQTLYALNRASEGLIYGDVVAANVNAQGSWTPTGRAFSSSFGNSLVIEVSAAATTLLGNNARWAAVRTRALNFLLANVGSLPANQGTIQAVRLLDATWTSYRNLNGVGQIQVLVNGVAVGNATNFTDAQ